VIDMATLDRIEPAFVAWTPSVSGLGVTDDVAEEYVGRHRRPSPRRSLFRGLFYAARHRRRR
jgi:hypothetical protein